MTTTARWVQALDARKAWHGLYRAVCYAQSCPGELAIWDPDEPEALTPPAGRYYFKAGDNRYRLGPTKAGRRPGWRYPGRSNEGDVANGQPYIRGREAAIPSVIVCSVCSRENAIAMAPDSH